MMMTRRCFTAVMLLLCMELVSCDKKESPQPYVVEEVPLSQISADLASGKTTSAAVTQAYIERIKTYDGALHAIIRLVPDALDQAKASDERRKGHHALGPLDGVPIIVKDNIDVVGTPTTIGSYAFVDNVPAKDSEVAKRLRAAGAVILAKANLDQFASFRSRNSLNGSTVGGTPHNPYALDHSASGSSNGSGIAAAVSFAAATVGSDTTGSVTAPASVMGLVGLRPTTGLISRRGIAPLSATMDTSGPLARNVTDAAMLLSALAGSDPGDPASTDADAHKTDYAGALKSDALKGARFGVVRTTAGYSEATKPLLDAALDVLKAQGAEVVEMPADLFEDMNPEEMRIMTDEFKEDLAAYLSAAPPAVKVRTMADLVAFNKTDEHETSHPQDLLEASEATDGRQSADYAQTLAYAHKRAGAEGIDRGLKEFNVDALVLLTTGPARLINRDRSQEKSILSDAPKGERPYMGSGIAALVGYPEISVTAGRVGELPVGLSFIGPAWSEATLFGYAYAYEQASHARVPPTAYKAAK